MVHTDGGWYYDGDDCILIHVSLLFIVVNRALFWSVTQTSPPLISLVCQSQFLQNNMNTLMSSIFQLICSQVQVGEKTDFPLTKMELACQEVSYLYSLYFPANNELWPQYRLPEVRYYKGSFILDSEHELTGVQQFRRPRWVLHLYLHLQLNHNGSNHCRPFWNYQENESAEACPAVLPGARHLTSLTYTGDRRRHPDLRLRLYEVLQHKA